MAETTTASSISGTQFSLILLLWIDENHDGISQPKELHSLPELGVYSLALKYIDSPRKDEFGNMFRYKSALNPDPKDGESKDGRWDYDVFLTAVPPSADLLPPDVDVASLSRGNQEPPCGANCATTIEHQSVAIGQGGKPSLHFTNDFKSPIVAFFMVEFPSLGMEGRTYFDVVTSARDQPILPGVSITKSLSSFSGAESKVRAEIRAVILQDGSSAGDQVWVNAILARRLRFHDRLLSLDNLLKQQVGTGVSREGIVAMLQATQADADKLLPQDDLRVMDDLAFYGAISTFETNRDAKVDRVLAVYLKYLEDKAAKIERSRPSLDTIKALPVAIPNPLSQATLPPDYWAAATALANKSGAKEPGSQLSSCTVLGAQFDLTNTVEDACYDEGDTNNKYTSFSNEYFGYYNASTGKTTEVPWSWSPGQNDLDEAWGQCVQYEDCDGDLLVFYEEGFATGVAAANIASTKTVEQGQNSASFYWTFDYYPDPKFSDCDLCDTYPAGQEDPISTNEPKPGVTFYFNYACVVTP